MPIPEPQPDEKREEFIERCMETVGEEEENEQALAICFDKWKEKDMINIDVLAEAQKIKTPKTANHHLGFTKFMAKADETAEILIYEDIGNDWFGGISAKSFAENLQKLGDVKEITVRMNSPGGSVFDGIAIYNLLRSHNANIRTMIDGIAASIASIIFMAGDERVSAKNGSLMIHAPWTIAAGNAEELREQADVLERLGNSLADTYSVRADMSVNVIKKMMAQETWFNSDEMFENGFVHDVIEELPIAAAIDFDFNCYRNCPNHVKTRYQKKIAQVNQMDRDARVKLATMAKRVMHNN